MATLNLPAYERFKDKHILLAAMANPSVYKAKGMSRVLAGVDSDGVRHDEPCYATDVDELDEGVWITIPDDERGGVEHVRLRASQVVVSVDYLAQQSLNPCAESTRAHRFCRVGCTYDSTHPAAGRPFSFLRKPSPQPTAAKAARTATPFVQKAWMEIKEVLDRARAAGSTERKKIMKAAGLTKLHCALEYIKHCDPTTSTPVDVLHLFPDGLLRSEGAWLFYIFLKMGLDIHVVNAAIRDYRNWPPDTRIPPLQESLKEGVTGGKPKSSKTLRMTGSQCMHFALHRFVTDEHTRSTHTYISHCRGVACRSPFLLKPLLTAEMTAHPAWRSWLCLVKLFGITVQHSITVADIELVDDLQLQHSAAFDAVYEYAGLKRPKHHFCAHLARDMWLYGPPRGYWCFGYEAFNKQIKAGAMRSNWRDTTYSIMEYWSMRSARAMIREKHAPESVQIV